MERLGDMKAFIKISLLLSLALIASSCRNTEQATKPEVLDRVRLSPVEGETWVYQVKVTLDSTDAQVPKSLLKFGPEGIKTSYEKRRRYLGLRAPREGAEKVYCFEITEDGKVTELEYTFQTEEGIFTRGSQKVGQTLMLMEPPVLIIPAQRLPGEGWQMGLPNPNDPTGPPMVFRRFSYFGVEELPVMNDVSAAHRVRILGKTGPIELQRDLYYSNKVGFVQDRRAYFSPEQRLALIEETLVEHIVPGE